jgi:predicted RNA-binding protein with PUA-like domain
MAHWLFKSEPETWSWDMQKKKGTKGEPWSGVRNHQAKLNMMAMKKGERGFFYHSGEVRAIVGIVEVTGAFRPDPSDASGKFGMVVVKALAELPKPVTLAQAKADPELARMTLVTFSRLSVQPVTEHEWQHVCALGGLNKPL